MIAIWRGTRRLGAGHPRCCAGGRCVTGVIRVVISALTIVLIGCGSATPTSTAVPVTSTITPVVASLEPLTPLTADSPYEGYHERNTCEVIGGWVYEKANPNATVTVEIFADATLLARMPANVFRQDLLVAGKGNGNHSFTLTTPPQLKDGKPHQISIRIANTNFGLTNTPMTLTCAS